MFAQNSAEVWLELLTITHADMATVRVVNNTESVISRGDVFEAFPFAIVFPTDVAERMASAQLTISNVDRRLVETIRSVVGRPRVRVEVIAASRPDSVEYGPLEFDLSNVQWDAETISGELTYEPVVQQSFPSQVFDPQRFPGLFGRAEAR